ncbi:hypothetical protein BSAF29S_02345 [Bacillus safensis subsp. safensis]
MKTSRGILVTLLTVITKGETDMARHHFRLQASWPGLRNDVGTIACEQLKNKDFDSKGNGRSWCWNQSR